MSPDLAGMALGETFASKRRTSPRLSNKIGERVLEDRGPAVSEFSDDSIAYRRHRVPEDCHGAKERQQLDAGDCAMSGGLGALYDRRVHKVQGGENKQGVVHLGSRLAG